MIGAVFVPRHVDDAALERWVARCIGGPASGRCMHVQPTTTGRWVCVLDAGHDGAHG